jgi:hypothetical protein
VNGLGFVANRLRYGNDLNVVLGELTEIEFLLERLAEETAKINISQQSDNAVVSAL